MKHEEYRKWLILALYDELGESSQKELDRHLGECSICREEFDGLKKLFLELDEVRSLEPSEDELEIARNDLLGALERERAVLPSGANRGTGRFQPRTAGLPLRSLIGSFGWLRFGVTAAAAVAIGFMAGRYTAAPGGENVADLAAGGTTTDSMDDRDGIITGIRFADPYPAGEEVELIYESVRPSRVKGSIKDPQVQRLLLQALTGEDNPGTRLQAASYIESLAEPESEPLMVDSEFKSAIIDALKYDDNVAVRQKSLSVLQKMPLDDEIREAYLHVLLRDSNPGMRVMVINCLEASGREGDFLADESVYTAFRQAAENEENGYVRMRSRALLEEVSQ